MENHQKVSFEFQLLVLPNFGAKVQILEWDNFGELQTPC